MTKLKTFLINFWYTLAVIGVIDIGVQAISHGEVKPIREFLTFLSGG